MKCPKCPSTDLIFSTNRKLTYKVEGVDKEGNLELGKLIEEEEGVDETFCCLECEHEWSEDSKIDSLSKDVRNQIRYLLGLGEQSAAIDLLVKHKGLMPLIVQELAPMASKEMLAYVNRKEE